MFTSSAKATIFRDKQQIFVGCHAFASSSALRKCLPYTIGSNMGDLGNAIWTTYVQTLRLAVDRAGPHGVVQVTPPF